MSQPTDMRARHARSSRQRYKHFVRDYRDQRLDDRTDEASGKKSIDDGAKKDSESKEAKPTLLGGKRREYLREYLRWLWPHRYGVGTLFVLALIGTGLQMIEPLFMRYIIDRVLLNTALDTPARLTRLNVAGMTFLAVVLLSSFVGVMREYRQRLLNRQVMLSLRRTLFNRLLHLPLPKLWDMKTGGILSRLTGDVETTSGLLQSAIVSPSISFIRLFIAIGVLLALNWRLAMMAMLVIPGAMLMSFVFSRRIRPIYRAVRKDVEEIDGRVGETFSGIRVVRAFGREKRELLDYMRGRHTVLRKELFAQRRELFLWTGWGLLISSVNVVITWYRRLPEHRRQRLHRRHHGVPVVHVPAPQPGLEHRQLVLGAAAIARRHGTRVRGPGDAGRQAGPARCAAGSTPRP